MSRKRSLLRLDRQLDALMLFVYCKMLLSSDLSDVCVQTSALLTPTALLQIIREASQNVI